jgi:hypothetical protein
MTRGEEKQVVLLKYYIILIAVLDGVTASSNKSNYAITFYSDNCGGQGENKFVMYLYAVTNVPIHSLTYKYISVSHTQ